MPVAQQPLDDAGMRELRCPGPAAIFAIEALLQLLAQQREWRVVESGGTASGGCIDGGQRIDQGCRLRAQFRAVIAVVLGTRSSSARNPGMP